MRRPGNVVGTNQMFSGDHAGRRQHMYRTRAPHLSPRYHLLNGLTSSPAPPPLSLDDRLPSVLQFHTHPGADDFRRPGTFDHGGSTPPSGGSGRQQILQSTAVLTLIVVASLSFVVGAIYLLIYFKSIKPMSARSRNYMQAAAAGASVGGGCGGGKMTEDDGGRARSTHPFFRRS